MKSDLSCTGSEVEVCDICYFILFGYQNDKELSLVKNYKAYSVLTENEKSGLTGCSKLPSCWDLIWIKIIYTLYIWFYLMFSRELLSCPFENEGQCKSSLGL